MKNLNKTIAVVCAFLVLANIALINFNDLSWAQNSGNYLGIGSMTLCSLAAYLSYKKEKKEDKNDK